MDEEGVSNEKTNDESETIVNVEKTQKQSEVNPKKFFWIIAIIFATIIFVLSVYVILSNVGVDKSVKNTNVNNTSKISTSTKNNLKEKPKEEKNIKVLSGFEIYKEPPVNISPNIEEYSIENDLSNVANKDDFTFSGEAKEKLVKNGFVVVPSHENEFFPLYEANRYSYVPNFVTTDSMLHNYHLMFDYLLKKLEKGKLTILLKDLNEKMLSESVAQYESLKKTEWEGSAKRNVAFFAVGSKLLDSSVEVPEFVKDEVENELELINEHKGIEKSHVMNIGNENGDAKEDYSQYVPRGHYDKTEELRNYFKAMMWYGRMTFRVKNTDEIMSGALIALALNSDGNNVVWNKIYEPINFFVGKSDDITYYQFNDLLKKVYGNDVSVADLSGDDKKFDEFVSEVKKLSPPQINSIPIFNSNIDTDREKEIKGFRFMGQRFTIDAAIFQRLVMREVGPKDKSCDEAPFSEGRMLSKGLDIVSAMGSGEALEILKDEGETEYACYPENMSKMRDYISNLSVKEWKQNLYWGWLYQLLPLLDSPEEGYPEFMKNKAWTRKSINTFLGSWAELKHDTILYAKQVYAEMGGDGGPEEKDDKGYVEPNPHLYARLASLILMTSKGLESRDLLTESMSDNLKKMGRLAMSLKVISEKELNGEKLTDEEYELIRSYGGQLEHFWIEVNKDEPEYKEMDRHTYLDENPAAIVADVATDPNGQVLEEATGKIFDIYVIVPIDGELKITNGGVYSYYEFTQPLDDRLTDKKWREMLNNDEAPSLPSWTDVFIAK